MHSERVRYVLVPGWYGSEDAHWQSHWQRALPNASRVEQQDWITPLRADWIAELDAEIRRQPGPVVLIAHSLGAAKPPGSPGRSGAPGSRRARGRYRAAWRRHRAGSPRPPRGRRSSPGGCRGAVCGVRCSWLGLNHGVFGSVSLAPWRSPRRPFEFWVRQPSGALAFGAPDGVDQRCSSGTNARCSTPVYSALGRMMRLLARCSKTWAVQPLVREQTKIGVNSLVGMPMK